MAHLKDDRKPSAGMGIVEEKRLWISSHELLRLLRADVANGIHHPCQRARREHVGDEEGFLVIGNASVIFLDKNNKDIKASHPFSLIEEYKVVDNDTFRYALKKKHFLKDDEILEFSFKLVGPDAANAVVEAMDKHVLIDTKIREEHGNKEVALSYYDPKLKARLEHSDSSVSQVVHTIEGERFIGKEWHPTERFIDTTDGHTFFLGPHHENVIMIINTRGICLLHPAGELEVHPWKSIKSYGAATHRTTSDTFGFVVPDPQNAEKDITIALATEAATAVHSCCGRYLKMLQKEDVKPAPFPEEYHPSD